MENIFTIEIVGLVAALITIVGAIYSIFFRKNDEDEKIMDSHNSILFIDDEIDDFEIVNTLRKNQYMIETLKDAENLEEDKIVKAKIIFVDFKGVGKKFGKQQGIDLIKALKSKYKDKKTVILFSAHSGFSLSHDLKAGDDSIPKNASTQDFINMINKYL